jgi:hypothetical protein
MTQIITDPAEQRAFAEALAELVYEMEDKERGLAQAFAHLQTTWKDAHAKRFDSAQTEMSLYLKAFYNRSQAYGEYLRQKAKAAEAYLDLGRA